MADSMEDSSPFYTSYGEFSTGYNREEAMAGLREAFRARQRQRQAEYVEHLILGSGLGESAAGTVRTGHYNPQTVLQPTTEAGEMQKGTNDRGFEEDSVQRVLTPPRSPPKYEETEEEHGKSSEAPEGCPSEAEKDDDAACAMPENVMRRFGGVAAVVQSVAEVQTQLDANLDEAEASLARSCAPFHFDEIIEALHLALRAAEDGDSTAPVELPTCSEVLHGVDAVMEYVHHKLIPLTAELVATLYAIAWMLQYTMIFVHSLRPTDAAEAQLRLELLARCVRWLGKIDRFIALALALELQWRAYKAFAELRASAEAHIGELLNAVENELGAVLQGTRFPRRRQKLLQVEREVMSRVKQVVVLLNEMDFGWVPQVQMQSAWKDEFLSRTYRRLHVIIAPAYLSASLGFIDEGLYKMDTSGKRLLFNRRSSNTNNSNNNTLNRGSIAVHAFSPTATVGAGAGAGVVGHSGSGNKNAIPAVSVATQVENARVVEKLSFQQIGAAVRSRASILVGIQLCMGARFMLRLCDSVHDEDWGFSMNEPPGPSNLITDAVKKVERFTDVVRERMRRRMNRREVRKEPSL